eukprot:gene12363-6031_t
MEKRLFSQLEDEEEKRKMKLLCNVHEQKFEEVIAKNQENLEYDLAVVIPNLTFPFYFYLQTRFSENDPNHKARKKLLTFRINFLYFPYFVSEEILYHTLFIQINKDNYSEFVQCSKEFIEDFDFDYFCQLIQKNFDEKDENSIEKTFYILTIFDEEPIPSDTFCSWVRDVSLRFIENVHYQKIIFTYLLFFISNYDESKKSGHFDLLFTIFRENVNNLTNEMLFFYNSFIKETQSRDNLTEFSFFLVDTILKTSDDNIVNLYTTGIENEKFFPTAKESAPVMEVLLNMMLENDGKEWKIEEFRKLMGSKEYLDRFSAYFIHDHEFSNFFYKKFADFVNLNIEDKKYEDWKYICVGISCIGHCAESWRHEIYDNLDYISLVLSKSNYPNDFVKSAVIESTALICSDGEIVMLHVDDIDKAIFPLILDPLLHVSKLAIQFSINFFEHPIAHQFLPKYIKQFNLVLKNSIESIHKNEHKSPILIMIIEAFCEFSTFQNSDVEQSIDVIQNILEFSKYDECYLQLVCVQFLSTPLFHIKKTDKKYVLKLLKMLSGIIQKIDTLGYEKDHDDEIDQSIEIVHANFDQLLGDEFSFYFDLYSYYDSFYQHFTQFKSIQLNETTHDLYFHFN